MRRLHALVAALTLASNHHAQKGDPVCLYQLPLHGFSQTQMTSPADLYGFQVVLHYFGKTSQPERIRGYSRWLEDKDRRIALLGVTDEEQEEAVELARSFGITWPYAFCKENLHTLIDQEFKRADTAVRLIDPLGAFVKQQAWNAVKLQVGDGMGQVEQPWPQAARTVIRQLEKGRLDGAFSAATGLSEEAPQFLDRLRLPAEAFLAHAGTAEKSTDILLAWELASRVARAFGTTEPGASAQDFVQRLEKSKGLAVLLAGQRQIAQIEGERFDGRCCTRPKLDGPKREKTLTTVRGYRDAHPGTMLSSKAADLLERLEKGADKCPH